MDSPGCRMFKFLGCEVLYREACYLAAKVDTRVDVEFLDKGLHDLDSDQMRDEIQTRIDAVDAEAGYEAILLGYARCNDGLVGLEARSLPLVIPKSHDCIALFFGSRQAYKEYFDKHPGTYYLTTGWMERDEFEPQSGQYVQSAYGHKAVMAKLGLAQSYDEMVAQYGKDNADYLLETVGNWTSHYDRILYLEMGTCDETPFVQQARRKAEQLDLEFHTTHGDISLLERMFRGQWNDDFLVVPCGHRIVARNDERILDCQPIEKG